MSQTRHDARRPAWRACRIGHILPVMERPDKPLVWLRGEVKTPPFSSDTRVEAGGSVSRSVGAGSPDTTKRRRRTSDGCEEAEAAGVGWLAGGNHRGLSWPDRRGGGLGRDPV